MSFARASSACRGEIVLIQRKRKLPNVNTPTAVMSHGQALETLAKSTSFSPDFSLGSVALLKAENRFNGLHRDIDNFGAASETVKTVADIQRRAVTPG